MSTLAFDEFARASEEAREREAEFERERRMRAARREAAAQRAEWARQARAEKAVLGELDPYDLTKAERRSYRTGKWRGDAVPSQKLAHAVTDAQGAAELAARVALMLEER